MNNYAVFGAGLVTGLLAGFGIGYFIQKKQHDKELDAVSKSYHDIFEEQRKRIEEADAELNKGKVVTSPESILRPLEGSRSDSKDYKHNYTAYSENGVVEDPTMVIQHTSSIKEPEIPLEDYVGSLHPVDSDEDEEDEKEEELYNEGLRASLEHEARRTMQPRIIKEEDYGNDETLEQESLFYYQGNDILVTEDDEEIHDLPLVVGDCLDKFGFRDNNEKRICVRNYKLGKDYEVIKIDGPYIP